MRNSTLIFESWSKSAAMEDAKAYFSRMDHARSLTSNEASPLLADTDLIQARAAEGLKGAVQTGILLGLLGAALGGPMGLAGVGAIAGAGYGFPIGQLLGQSKANKNYLKDKGVDASLPSPLPALLLPPAMATAVTTLLPGSGHLNLKKTND